MEGPVLMAFKINVTSGFEWPSGLARPLDVDGAFRRAACLATARLCEILRGYSEHGPRWSAGTVLDSHAVMNACFAWDEGEENLREIGGGIVKVNVTPGAFLFSHVPSRTGKRVDLSGLDPDEAVEALADAGALSKCLASKYPYKVWWRTFNKAVYRLLTDIEYEGHVTIYRSLALDTYYYHVYPLCLIKHPDGTACLGPDDLCVEWTPNYEAADRVVVPAGYQFLVTPNDINFARNWFGDGSKPSVPTGVLRNKWVSLAASIGFTSFAAGADAPKEADFIDGYVDWWHGKTGPKFTQDKDRLRQLWEAWVGDVDSWRAEFPYHGLVSQVAVLDYLESCTVGFAIEDDSDQGVPQDDWHVITNFARAALSEVSFTPRLGESVRIEPGSWTVSDSEEYLDSYRPPEYSRVCSVNGGVVATAVMSGAIDWTVPNLIRYDNPSIQWSCSFDTGGVLARYKESGSDTRVLADALNDMWKGLVLSENAAGIVRFSFTSTYSETRTMGSVSVRSYIARLFENWDYVPVGGTSYPFSHELLTTTYAFLRTTNRAAILKLTPDDYLSYEDILRPEVERCPEHFWSGGGTDLPGPGSGPIYADVECVDSPFVVEKNGDKLNVEGTGLVDMFLIKFQGRKLFPPDAEIPPGQPYVELGDVSIGNVTAELPVSYADESDYTDVESECHTYLERQHVLRFIKYPRNVIYPVWNDG